MHPRGQYQNLVWCCKDGEPSFELLVWFGNDDRMKPERSDSNCPSYGNPRSIRHHMYVQTFATCRHETAPDGIQQQHHACWKHFPSSQLLRSFGLESNIFITYSLLNSIQILDLLRCTEDEGWCLDWTGRSSWIPLAQRCGWPTCGHSWLSWIHKNPIRFTEVKEGTKGWLVQGYAIGISKKIRWFGVSWKVPAYPHKKHAGSKVTSDSPGCGRLPTAST